MPLSHRTERIAEQMREEVSQILATEVADPGIGFVTVTPRQGDARPAAGARLLDHPRRRRRAQEDRQGAAARHAVRPPRAGRPAHAAARARGALPVRRRAGGAQHRIEQILHELHQEEAARAEPPRPRPTDGGGARRRRADPPTPMTLHPTPEPAALAEVVARLRTARRFVVSSHARPDGDAIGSGMAMALALRAHRQVEVRMVIADRAAALPAPFPGVDAHRVTPTVTETFDAAVIMECSDLVAHRRRRPRPIAGHQHRPPPRQHRLRRDELGRRVGRGVRRAGVRR